MQKELQAEHPDLPIYILAVNAEGFDGGLADLCEVGDLPVLQDTDEASVWSRWQAEWRDVVILGPDNTPIATYNLSEHSLADAEDYAALKAMFVEAARGR